MKRAHLIVAIAAGASLVAAGQAEALVKKPKPPKPVCQLVLDAPSDANGINPGSPVPPQTNGASTDALDITSVDVASDKTNITAVLRVKKLAATASNAPTGINWTVNFTVASATFSLAAHADPTGKISYDAAYAAATGGNLYADVPTGSFDTVKNEIHITVPLTMLVKQATIKPSGTKITAINGTTGQEILVPDASGQFGGTLFSDAYNTADNTTPGKDYTSGQLSCVTPGK